MEAAIPKAINDVISVYFILNPKSFGVIVVVQSIELNLVMESLRFRILLGIKFGGSLTW